jgi:hypothetical protein
LQLFRQKQTAAFLAQFHAENAPLTAKGLLYTQTDAAPDETLQYLPIFSSCHIIHTGSN